MFKRAVLPSIRSCHTLLVATVMLAGCGAGAFDNSAPLTIFDNFRIVEEGRVYRSAQLDAESLEMVFDQYGIRTVVNLRGANAHERWYQNEVAATQEGGVALVNIAMSAGKLPAREKLLQLFDTFQTAQYPILIHCESGADRTGAASAIWRMEIRGDSRQAAAAELSPLYGHFPQRFPAMDELVRVFQPDRTWIEREYPAP